MQVHFLEDEGQKPHFDHVFVFSSAYGSCVRDAFQAMKRVRQFGSPELFYCCDTLTNPKEQRRLSTSLEAAGRHVKRMEWLQEHYSGQTVLCAEEDVLNQVLTSDLQEESTAAQRMRTLQGQLRAARQQGMPAWLFDVHSHNILESHLSKGHHEECFDVFLKQNAYTIRMYDQEADSQDHVAQPPMLEGDEELIGLAGLVQGGPTGPAQGNPGYAMLKRLEQHEMEQLEHDLHRGQDGYHLGQPVNMLLEKFYFDKRLNLVNALNSVELRALVFDEICAASFKKQRFLRMYSELHNTAPNIAENTLPGNPYLGMWPVLAPQISAMHLLCNLLEIESSQDLTSEIPRARLDANKDQLARIVKDLQELCQVPDPKRVCISLQQNVEETKKAVNGLKTAIGQVLTAFSNTKLSTFCRGQARGATGRADNPTYKIVINMVKVEDIKQLDPFTDAVIKLLKPQPVEDLEFLPDA